MARGGGGRLRWHRALVGLLLFGTLGCATVAPATDGAGGSATRAAPPTPELAGTGEFTVRVEGFPDLPVHYAASGSPQTARIVVVLHGVQRNAADYRDAWVPLIAGHDAIVVAPEFSDDDYPGADEYNLGRLADGVPEREWAFTLVEAVFDETVRRAGGDQRSYGMFGHSAGAQFVHRFVEFRPDARFDRAVAANAGWYTMPDDESSFPYGLAGAPDTDLRRALGRDLVVLLGGADTGDENLRTGREANRQGATRLERGFAFYLAAQRAAEDAGVRLAWSLEVVPGTGHDNAEMAVPAAHLLLPG